jgi:hypothetical protein
MVRSSCGIWNKANQFSNSLNPANSRSASTTISARRTIAASSKSELRPKRRKLYGIRPSRPNLL